MKERSGSSAVPGLFWLGTGIGFVLSTVAVIAAVQFSHRRRRPLRGVENLSAYFESEADLVDDLSSAVHEGLHVLASAAKQVSETFNAARREVIRFGLDSVEETNEVGSSGAGWYFEDEGPEDDEGEELVSEELEHLSEPHAED